MNKIEFELKSWRDVSIDTYYDICDILKDESLTESEKNIQILSLATGIDPDTIYNLDIMTVKNALDKLAWLNDFELDKKIKFDKIKLAGEKYIVDADLTHFTTAQYIDFQTLWAKKDLRKYYGNILACFIIPKGHKYADDYDVNALATKLRQEIDILTANEIVFFYLQNLVNSILASQIYLALQIVKNRRKMTDQQYQALRTQWRQTLKDILAGLSA